MNAHIQKVIASIDLTPLPGSGGNNTDQAIQTALSATFGILGAVAVFVIVLAGFKYVLSHGDPKIIEQSKNAILYAVIGLIVCIAAFGIINVVLGSV